MNRPSTWRAWLAGLAFAALCAACATTVAISGRFPARFPETNNIRRIAVARFEGPGGADFTGALTAQLVGATFDGQRYFTIVGVTEAPVNLDGPRASAFGRAAKADGVLFGAINVVANTEAYQGSEIRCVLQDDKKCRQYRAFAINCWRRTIQLSATPRLVRTSSGQLVYSSQKAAGREIKWCEGGSPSAADEALAASARDQIIEDIRRDIGPYNAVLNATLKMAGDGLAGDQKGRFAAATKAATNGDMAEACRIWEQVNAATANNLPTVYDLGVCAESSGAFGKALGLYRQAQGLSKSADPAIRDSIARTEQLLQASGQLAQQKARGDAEEKAERQRQEAVAAGERQRAAQQAATQQRAVAAGKAAEAERQRSARAKYGAAATAVLAGRIEPGMTRDQVIAARGKPQAVRKLSPTDEIWSYGGQRVMFANGRVTQVR
jgi:hypothetical protein